MCATHGMMSALHRHGPDLTPDSIGPTTVVLVCRLHCKYLRMPLLHQNRMVFATRPGGRSATGRWPLLNGEWMALGAPGARHYIPGGGGGFCTGFFPQGKISHGEYSAPVPKNQGENSAPPKS